MAPQPDTRLDQQLLAFRGRLVAQAWDLRERLEDELALADMETTPVSNNQPEGLIPRAWQRTTHSLGSAFCALRAAPVMRRRSQTSTIQPVAKGRETLDPNDDPKSAVTIIDIDIETRGGEE